MIRETHYERSMRGLTPLLADARQLVDKYDWAAWDFTLKHHLAPATGHAVIWAKLRKIFDALGPDAHIYEKFYRRPDILKFFQQFSDAMIDAGMSPDVVESEISTQLAQMWHTFMFDKYGKRTYDVSPGLAERLMQTQLRGLKTDDLQLPYPSIYVMVPPDTGLRVWNYSTKWHPVEGVYVTEAVDPDYGRVWRFLVVGPSKNPKSEFDDALFYFTVPLLAGKVLDEALEEEHKRVFTRYMEREVIREYGNEWLILFRWVLNVVVYSTYPDARREEVIANPEARKLTEQLKRHPKGSNKHDRTRNALRGLEPMRRTVLGKGIERWSLEARGLSVTGRTLNVRVLVQGHWRNQAHGPQLSLRKLMWINPFWRGPDVEEDLNKVHYVG